MAAPPRVTSVGTGLIDAALEPTPFDFSGAEAWRVLVLLGGTPAAVVELPAPGAVGGPALVRAVFVRRADAALARGRLIDDLLTRIGARRPTPRSSPAVSVVLCTHRRPQDLARVIDALGRLDPAPAEIIIVDNAPGEQDCRDAAEAAGLRYLREDRQGLDNARNAGVRAAKGELIAFTDDDCIPSPGWLAVLPELFEDPMVAGVTGPMFPHLLDTPSRVHMERIAGMTRGLRRQTFDWQNISAVHAGAIGVGANMAFRRSVLEELGEEPFPSELDAGTPTESGGDTFVIAQVIARGYRLIYAPEMFGFHVHREDPAALRRAVRGYGIGISAAMTKLLVEQREAESWRGWWWLVKQYLRIQRRRVVGRADALDASLSREYIVGGLLGPGRWRASARAQRLLGPAEPKAPGGTILEAAAARVELEPPSRPRISVVIPTHRRLDSLTRCLDSLAEQTVPSGSFEVLVIDDADPPELDASALVRGPAGLRLLQSRGAGASAARNLGAQEARAPVVLFLDDDMVAEPQLIERHLAHHLGAEAVAVVGAYPPARSRRGLMASAVALWWSDLFESMRTAVRPTFVFMLSGNLSIPRYEFLAVGGFAHDIPFRREDWELGLRWLDAGYRIEYDPLARAQHEFTLPTAARLRGAELEGYGDAVLATRYPGVLGSLPLVADRPASIGSRARRLGLTLAQNRHASRGSSTALNALERANLRTAWLRLLKPAQIAAYKSGLERAGGRPADQATETFADCELLSPEPIPSVGPVAPTLRVTLRGERLALVRPFNGHWGPHIAEQVADAIGPENVERVAAARGWLAREDPPAPEELTVEVIAATPEPPTDHWLEVAAKAAASQSEVVALPLLGTSWDSRWLAESLAAFGGERVDGVFGLAIDDERPVQPLYLHDQAFPPAFALGDAPAYLAVRTAALRALGGVPAGAARWGSLAPAAVMIEAILASGAVVGRRDVHGIAAAGLPASAAEQGRAWGAARLWHSPEPARALASGAAAMAATLAWQLLKQRGRVERETLEAMAGAARGALSSAAVARRRGQG
jgi:glycosyltransferase involved in cell wall biosynthesis